MIIISRQKICYRLENRFLAIMPENNRRMWPMYSGRLIFSQLMDFLPIHQFSRCVHTTHKHTKVRRWLAARPRYHVHYTPTYASWLNQVEIWFNIITQKAIRRGTFRSVKDLIDKIKRFVDQYNKNSRPFLWTATADSILAKIERLCKGIAGTAH